MTRTAVPSAALALLLAACATPNGATPAAPQPSPAAAPSAPAPRPEPPPHPAAPAAAGLRVALQRTGCYGACPIYRVEVLADGAVHYRGDRFVKTVGEAEGRVSDATLAELDRALTEAEFFTLDAAYTRMSMTDMPSAVVTGQQAGRIHTVKHYLGDKSAPAALTALEARIDALVDIEQWIGTQDERMALPRVPIVRDEQPAR